MVKQALMEQREGGLTPVSDGWFVVGVREAAWSTHDVFGDFCMFESEPAPFADFGINLAVLEPGKPNGLYHRETAQEDFLVLAGECLLLIEGEERALKAWDFVHCPPETDHIFVGAGSGPCVILMVGARKERESIVYPRSDLALRHGAGVEIETPSPDVAYARYPREKPGRRISWDGLPWG
jgi:uncharacterized cupin superfamily protein